MDPRGLETLISAMLISDMHIGGDGELENCDFEIELSDFLKHLERKDDAELVINGTPSGCGSSPPSRVWRSSRR